MARNSPTLKRGGGEFIRDIHKIEVDTTLTQITAKNGIKRHIKRVISSM